jgi:FKBP-type peptidyl-prolyl cis-trans isomerase
VSFGTALLASTCLVPARVLAADSGDWSSPGLAKPGDSAKYERTASGVVYELISAGSGDEAARGDVVQFHYTLRRANGYFIFATIECGVGCGDGTPEVATLGKTPLIAGLEELMTGMRPGEKRRALIPPALGYVTSGLLPQPPDFGQRRQVIVHASEPLVFEVRLVKVKKP